jgi:hypothetical protein
MVEAFNTWFRIGLLLYGLAACVAAVVAVARDHVVWAWWLVADTVWHAGSLGLMAVGVAWLAESPDLVPPLVARYGLTGALAVGTLWGALAATAERRAWAALWDGYLWQVPALARRAWERCWPRPPGRRSARGPTNARVVAPVIDVGLDPALPRVRSPRRHRRSRRAADWRSDDDPRAPGGFPEEEGR